MVIARTCPRCGGQGSAVKKSCQACRGEGFQAVERTIQVKVPPGVESGMRLRLGGEGEAGTRGRGDLYVHLGVAPHPIFHREGPHLILEYPVDITQAALGTEVEIPTMNGRVSMKIPAGTQSGTVFRVRGKGLADVRDGRSGDLLVRVVVETPTHLGGPQQRLLEELARQLGEAAHPARHSFLHKVRALLNP
jgi:molecular chaperone DnaJ